MKETIDLKKFEDNIFKAWVIFGILLIVSLTVAAYFAFDYEAADERFCESYGMLYKNGNNFCYELVNGSLVARPFVNINGVRYFSRGG